MKSLIEQIEGLKRYYNSREREHTKDDLDNMLLIMQGKQDALAKALTIIKQARDELKEQITEIGYYLDLAQSLSLIDEIIGFSSTEEKSVAPKSNIGKD